MPPRSRAPARKTLTLAREVSELFRPHLAVLAFPAAGMPTLFGNPTIESILRSFLPAAATDARTETADQAAARVKAMRREAGSIEARVAQEEAWLRAVAGKVKAAQEEQGREHWWEVMWARSMRRSCRSSPRRSMFSGPTSSAASTSWPKLRSHGGSSSGTSPHVFVSSHHQGDKGRPMKCMAVGCVLTIPNP